MANIIDISTNSHSPKIFGSQTKEIKTRHKTSINSFKCHSIQLLQADLYSISSHKITFANAIIIEEQAENIM
jgi:hypothetical protein